MSLHTLDQLPDSRQIITYQFHAFLGNKKTTPQDGLCLAALISLNWLKLRLGKHIPEVLRHIPGPEQYRTTALSDLPLVSIRQGFSVNVAYLPDEGIWTMRIAEPDFGTDPDAPLSPGVCWRPMWPSAPHPWGWSAAFSPSSPSRTPLPPPVRPTGSGLYAL